MVQFVKRQRVCFGCLRNKTAGNIVTIVTPTKHFRIFNKIPIITIWFIVQLDISEDKTRYISSLSGTFHDIMYK